MSEHTMHAATIICVLTLFICDILSNTNTTTTNTTQREDDGNNDTDNINKHFNWRLVNKERCGSSLTDRIIGGIKAGLGQFPWLARLGYSNLKRDPNDVQFSCGGSLVTECWVLSAAHCVVELPDSIYLSAVRLGEYNTNQEIDCVHSVCADLTQDFLPTRILIHKDYGKPRFKHDISLIKLHSSVRITKWVQPICLPYGNLLEKSLIGIRAEVAGWGIVDVKTARTSTVLQTVRLPVIKNRRCSRAFRKKVQVDFHQLCVGGETGYDSCGGDSGGPLMIVDVVTSPKYYVFGIVSFGSKHCGLKPYPAVYTNISLYLRWILDNLTSCNCH